MTFEDGFSCGLGEEAWISGSWRIPNPSELAWSRLMNLGHWHRASGKDWLLALESTAAGTFQVSYAPYGGDRVLLFPARPTPANRWFRVHLRSNGNTTVRTTRREGALGSQDETRRMPSSTPTRGRQPSSRSAFCERKRTGASADFSR